MVNGAGRPSNILKDTYLARLMAHKRKTRFSFKEHVKSGAHLLAPRPEGFKGWIVGEFMLLLDGISVGDEDTVSASTVT